MSGIETAMAHVIAELVEAELRQRGVPHSLLRQEIRVGQDVGGRTATMRHAAWKDDVDPAEPAAVLADAVMRTRKTPIFCLPNTPVGVESGLGVSGDVAVRVLSVPNFIGGNRECRADVVIA